MRSFGVFDISVYDDGKTHPSVQDVLTMLQDLFKFLMSEGLDGVGAYRYLVQHTIGEMNHAVPFRVFSKYMSRRRTFAVRFYSPMNHFPAFITFH